MKKGRLLRFAGASVAAGILAVFTLDAWVRNSTKARMFDAVSEVPHKKVALLLGTAKWLQSGQLNLFYKYRIDAAVELYRAGKAAFILVSGDNSKEHYNEPECMRADLVAAGIPPDKIFLDYAGFRTLDSIVRCREIFGEDDIIVVSQPFHNARALFLADRKGIRAVAYNARDVKGSSGVKILAREKLARSKMMLDLVVGKEPKFYGDRISIK